MQELPEDVLGSRITDAIELFLAEWVLPSFFERDQIEGKRPVGSDQYVIRGARWPKDQDVRKDRLKGGQDAAIGARRDLVALQPLREQAVHLQSRRGDLEEVLGEDVGDAGDPRMRRLRNDHIVFVEARGQYMARVVHQQL